MKLDELFEFEPQFNLKYFLFQVLHKLDTSFVSACIYCIKIFKSQNFFSRKSTRSNNPVS